MWIPCNSILQASFPEVVHRPSLWMHISPYSLLHLMLPERSKLFLTAHGGR